MSVPRSTGSWMPVTCRASSEAIQATAAAMSSGWDTWSGSDCMKIGPSVAAYCPQPDDDPAAFLDLVERGFALVRVTLGR